MPIIETGRVEPSPAIGFSGNTDHAQHADISFGPILVRSVAVTALVMLIGVGVPMWLLTGEIWDGVGLGAFTAFWDGPGFGVMAAGARWIALQERR